MIDLLVDSSATTAIDFSYNYDANGRVTTITDHATRPRTRVPDPVAAAWVLTSGSHVATFEVVFPVGAIFEQF